MNAPTDMVLAETRRAANGKSIGFVALNAPRSLNALSFDMAQALFAQLERWRSNADIACVVLQGAGDKAFCAGGDIVALYRNLTRTDGERHTREYFELEYTLDYSIHVYPKPILCWGHGIVMGGGLGLMAGASHRVVTETARLAMPEITIGLYPDVGATWFLQRMPGRLGLFFGLTGAQVNAADALFLKLADHYVRSEDKPDIFDNLLQLDWDDAAESNRHRLSMLLRRYKNKYALPHSPLREHFDLINDAMDYPDAEKITTALANLSTGDAWLERTIQTLLRGSPTSAKVIHEAYRRGKHLSLKEAFAMELGLTLQFARHPDLREGIRALLIDKDNRPQWSPPTLAEVSDQTVDTLFFSPWPPGQHPFRHWDFERTATAAPRERSHQTEESDQSRRS